jgi:ABC-type branched-subunit amino acid transport system ATPase component
MQVMRVTYNIKVLGKMMIEEEITLGVTVRERKRKFAVKVPKIYSELYPQCHTHDGVDRL